ncbi:MAG: FHA domain-containing protein [Gammaproteobacteria bacterium]
MAKLTLSFKDKRLKVFPLTGQALVIGRDPDCNVPIDSLAVQPRHARIYAEGEAYRIENLQTETPIRLNQQPISEATALRDGDQIQVGKHTLSFSHEPAAEGPPAELAPAQRLPAGGLQIMSGSHLGRTIRLDRAMTRLGKTGRDTAVISRRGDGYYIAHLEGDLPPQVNDRSIAENSCPLHDGDRIRIGRLELHFYLDGAAPAATEGQDMQENQRRFTRIPFDAEAVLRSDADEWPCEVIDLSLKGALIREPHGWAGKPGEHYRLSLMLDQDTRIQMDVSVAHRENQHVGLFCQDIDLDSITHLRRLVELNLGDPDLLERELMALG